MRLSGTDIFFGGGGGGCDQVRKNVNKYEKHNVIEFKGFYKKKCILIFIKM